MKSKYWKELFKAAGIRALKTVLQTFVATIGVAVVMSDVNWIAVGSASLLAGIVSFAQNMATGLPEVDEEV